MDADLCIAFRLAPEDCSLSPTLRPRVTIVTGADRSDRFSIRCISGSDDVNLKAYFLVAFLLRNGTVVEVDDQMEVDNDNLAEGTVAILSETGCATISEPTTVLQTREVEYLNRPLRGIRHRDIQV